MLYLLSFLKLNSCVSHIQRSPERASCPWESSGRSLLLHLAPSWCWVSCWLLLEAQPSPQGSREQGSQRGPRLLNTTPPPGGAGNPTPKGSLPLRHTGLVASQISCGRSFETSPGGSVGTSLLGGRRRTRNVPSRLLLVLMRTPAHVLSPLHPSCHFLPLLSSGPASLLGQISEDTSSLPGPPAPSSLTFIIILTTGMKVMIPDIY